MAVVAVALWGGAGVGVVAGAGVNIVVMVAGVVVGVVVDVLIGGGAVTAVVSVGLQSELWSKTTSLPERFHSLGVGTPQTCHRRQCGWRQRCWEGRSWHDLVLLVSQGLLPCDTTW